MFNLAFAIATCLVAIDAFQRPIVKRSTAPLVQPELYRHSEKSSISGFTPLLKQSGGGRAHRQRQTSVATKCVSTAAWGDGLSQEDLMNKDECIVVDANDLIVGHDSKYNTHRFDKKNPSGILHRAFSVFLFNEDGNLLLQRRASDKITFPSVWTNTCCSHPLYGYSPSEVDDEHAVSKGELPGEESMSLM